MARIPNIYFPFSAQTLTSAATVTSDSMNIGRAAFAALQYTLSTATTGTYVSCTARILLAADPSLPFLAPVDDAGTALADLAQVNSNNRYVQSSIPLAPWAQLRLISVTNNTITFDSVHLVLDENN